MDSTNQASLSIEDIGKRYNRNQQFILLSFLYAYVWWQVLLHFWQEEIALWATGQLPEFTWLPIAVFLLLLLPLLGHAWKNNWTVWKYKNVLLEPHALVLEGRYSFIADLQLPLPASLEKFLWYQHNHLLASSTSYCLYAVQQGKTHKIALPTSLATPDYSSAIAAHYQVPILRYRPRTVTQLFWKEYPNWGCFSYSPRYKVILAFMALAMPIAFGAVLLLLYAIFTYWTHTPLKDYLLIAGVGVVMVAVFSAFLQSTFEDGYPAQLKQFFLIKAVSFQPNNLILHYRWKKPVVLEFSELEQVVAEESKVYLKSKQGLLLLPYFPFKFLTTRLARYYKIPLQEK